MNILDLPQDLHKEIINKCKGSFQALTSTCKSFREYSNNFEIDARSNHLLSLLQIFPEKNWNNRWVSLGKITWEHVEKSLSAKQTSWDRIIAHVKIQCCKTWRFLIKYRNQNMISCSLVSISLSALRFFGIISNKYKILSWGFLGFYMICCVPLIYINKENKAIMNCEDIIYQQYGILNKTYDWDFDALSSNSKITWSIIMDNFYHPITGEALPWNFNAISSNTNITWDIVMKNSIHPITKQKIKWNFSILAQNPSIDLEKLIQLEYYNGKKVQIYYENMLPGLTIEMLDLDPLIVNSCNGETRLSQIFPNLNHVRAAICDLKAFNKLPTFRGKFYIYEYILHHNTIDKILSIGIKSDFPFPITCVMVERAHVNISLALKYPAGNVYEPFPSWNWSKVLENNCLKPGLTLEDYNGFPLHCKKILSEPITWRIIKDNPGIPWSFQKLWLIWK